MTNKQIYKFLKDYYNGSDIECVIDSYYKKNNMEMLKKIYNIVKYLT